MGPTGERSPEELRAMGVDSEALKSPEEPAATGEGVSQPSLGAEQEPGRAAERDPRERLRREIDDLLEREGFTLSPEMRAGLEEQIGSKESYITLAGTRNENGKAVERSLKIPVELDDDPEVDERFTRQVAVARALEEDGRVKTRRIIAAQTDRGEGTPYAVMETFPKGAEIGSIESTEGMKRLTEREAQGCVRTLKALHEVDLESLPPDARETLDSIDGSYDRLEEELGELLDQEVVALDAPSGQPEVLHEVLNRRLGVSDFRERALALCAHWKEAIASQENPDKETLLHGDLSPEGLYVHDDGETEFRDWEWAGRSNNKATATINDYGNLRARAWNNRGFREALDASLREQYRADGQEDLGRAVVSLGILRSHVDLAGFFENDDPATQRQEEERQRREATEGDIRKAWEVAGLPFA